jgi:hypothetical protein
MWRFAFLGLAFLGLTVSCTDGPIAPGKNTDGLSLQFGDPPPPPVDGDILGTFSVVDFSASVVASSTPRDCDLLGFFCVPGRYFQNKEELVENPTEWLDFLPEAPLPNDIKRQLKEGGATCFDVLTNTEVICDVNSTAQGRLFEKNLVGDGKGLAYDVGDGSMVLTIALDQFDGFPNPLNCISFEGFVSCDTFGRPVFADSWVRGDDGNYTKGPPQFGSFTFTAGEYPSPEP